MASDPFKKRTLKIVAGTIAAMAVAGGLGWVVGGPVGTWLHRPVEETAADDTPNDSELTDGLYRPPMYLSLDGSHEDAEALMNLAIKNGVTRFYTTVPLLWSTTTDTDLEKVLGPLAKVPASASLLINVSLNPPAPWFIEHPDAVSSGGNGDPYPSAASGDWLAGSEEQLSQFLASLETAGLWDRVEGIVIGALENQQWYRRFGYENSAANRAGFQAWLEDRYKEEALLQVAWADTSVTFGDVAIPSAPDSADTSQVFFDVGNGRKNIDYLQYLSESIANAINRVAGHVKTRVPEGLAVYAKYGYSIEGSANDLGHLALQRVLDGPADGIVAPVSYKTRDLKAAGSPVGPAGSALIRGKRWMVFDDTIMSEGGSAEDAALLVSAHKRNAAAALAGGFGYIWSCNGLKDAQTWDTYQRLAAAYATVWAPRGEDEEPLPGPFLARADQTGICVVVDETSRSYQQCDTKLNNIILAEVAESVMRAGVHAEFVLMRDVLEGKAKPAAVYLFCNAFRIDAEDRITLHAMLQRQQAWAIWVYAPGYISDNMVSAENVSAATRMTVRAFEGPAQGGSVCRLEGGRWLTAGYEFGDNDRWQPLFYIDDPDADLIAEYRDSGKASVAVKFYEEGSGSVFVADPALPPNLLREILGIFGQEPYLRDSVGAQSDVVCIGPNVLTIYANTPGDRSIDLGTFFNVRDLLNPNVGWSGRQFITLSMAEYETHILWVEPILQADTPPEPEEAEPSE